MKKTIALLLSLALVLQIAACDKTNETTVSENGSETESETAETSETEAGNYVTPEYGVIHEPEFGGVYIKITIFDFDDQFDISYGDSVNVHFSNGVDFIDIPYFNGYYVSPGENLLVAYPGYDYIKLACNFGEDLFETSGLTEDDTAWIELNEEGKYADIQVARDISYVDDRNLYPGDAVFANFRSCNVGNLKKNILYRSASPCDNQHNRAAYTDELCEEAGIKYILDLADNETKVQGYMASPEFNSDYFASLYENGNVGLLGLSANYNSPDFKAKLASGIIAMIEHDGPYLVHCTEGKDRTGLVCIIFEMLAGATYDEMLEDYMMTYFNYYGIARFTDPDRYRLIKENLFDDMIMMIMDVDSSYDFVNVDYTTYVEGYLMDCGMSAEQVEMLKARLIG